MVIKKCILLGIMSILLLNCSESLRKSNSQYYTKNPKKNQFYFFPKGTLGDNNLNKDDSSLRNRYSWHLIQMKEISLSTPDHEFESAYRFLWVRSFHNPIAVRVEKIKNQIVLIATELEEQEDESGNIIKSIKIKIPVNEFQRFCELLIETNFWNMENKPSCFSNHDGTVTIGADGAHWILEGNDNGKYHVVDQWNPDLEKYRQTCLYLIKLAGFNVKPDEIY